MARYIDADKFIKDLEDEYHGMISDESLKIYKIIHRLCDEPAADVVEVKHGEWLYSRVHNILYCSECGEIPDCFEPPYCPNCGAKMDGGKI